MQTKPQRFLIGILIFGLLASLSDLSFLLFGGEYLARQLIPSLPANSILEDCFSQHTVLCRNITFSTSQSPQDFLRQWSLPIDQHDNSLGQMIYHAEACNESRLGLHYARFHKRPGLACADISAWIDQATNTTQVLIQLNWSVCPKLIDEYNPRMMSRYFRCYEG